MSFWVIVTKPADMFRKRDMTRATVVHLNFRAGSSFPVPVCIVLPGHWVNKADTQ